MNAPTAPSLRLAFFGTPEFATPTLERLLAGRHSVVSIVSQPDRRRGRGRRISASPVAEVALREGLPLLRPEKVGAPEVEEALRASRPDHDWSKFLVDDSIDALLRGLIEPSGLPQRTGRRRGGR